MPSCHDCGAKLQANKKCNRCGITSGDSSSSDKSVYTSPAQLKVQLRKFKNKTSRRSLVLLALLILGLASLVMVPGLFLKLNKPKIQSELTGTWETQTFSGQNLFPGSMAIKQSGTKFSGVGKDSAGTFQITGEMQPPNKVTFAKQYDMESKKRGAISNVINFNGELAGENGTSTLAGEYVAEKRVGFEHSQFNPVQMKQLTGTWKARQVSLNFQNSDITKLPPLSSVKTESTAFITIGIVCIVSLIIGVVVVFVVFSPNGLLIRFIQGRYIPTQFKSQHSQLLKQFGFPLEPGGWPLGKRLDWKWFTFWTPKLLNLPTDVRKKNPHMLLIGGSDQGKSRLIASLVTHDIKANDSAVVVIDSDGELSDLILHWIKTEPQSEQISQRLILIDPMAANAQDGQIRSYNPLGYPKDGDLQAAAQAVVHGFKAIYTEPPGTQSKWDAQTSNILRNAALLLIINGRSLSDLPALLQDNDFRDVMLEAIEMRKNEKAEYISVLETWNQYKKLARTDQWITWVEPILNRVGPMLSDGRIRPILTERKSELNLNEVIKEKKIVLVRIPFGELDKNANLLGSFIVTGLQQAAISLGRASEECNRRVVVYLDEMESFIAKDTLSNITSESSRYQMGLVGSILTLQTLPEDYRNNLLVCMGNLAVFALSRKDADILGPQLFRVDGRKAKQLTFRQFFNPINATRDYLYVSDEEKLNIDRLVGQEVQCYFYYRVGTIAGVFKLKAPSFMS